MNEINGSSGTPWNRESLFRVVKETGAASLATATALLLNTGTRNWTTIANNKPGTPLRKSGKETLENGFWKGGVSRALHPLTIVQAACMLQVPKTLKEQGVDENVSVVLAAAVESLIAFPLEVANWRRVLGPSIRPLSLSSIVQGYPWLLGRNIIPIAALHLTKPVEKYFTDLGIENPFLLNAVVSVPAGCLSSPFHTGWQMSQTENFSKIKLNLNFSTFRRTAVPRSLYMSGFVATLKGANDYMNLGKEDQGVQQ